MNQSNTRVAFCGTRGLPANYGGFETALDEITKRFVKNGIHCEVFCRGDQNMNKETYEGRELVYIKGSKHRKLDTFVSSIHTGLYLIKHRKEYDFIFWFNNANFPGILLTLLTGVRMAINTDGLEWRRAKWSLPFKAYYFLSSFFICLLCKTLISDSVSIQNYYMKTFKKKTQFIPYGAPETKEYSSEIKKKILGKYGLEEGNYFLQITRFEPDNLPLEIIKQFQNSLLGDLGYQHVLIGLKDETEYAMKIKAESGRRGVKVFPANYNQTELTVLRNCAYCYVHGNSVGGTNPALLEAMQSTKRILAIDCPFSEEVLGAHGKRFTIENLSQVFIESLHLEDQSLSMKHRIKLHYQWDKVADSYKNITQQKSADYAVLTTTHEGVKVTS
jgi:glycosyltransferase involved in cell wall biosynthesis